MYPPPGGASTPYGTWGNRHSGAPRGLVLADSHLFQGALVPKALNKESLDGWLKERSGWKREGDAIAKEFKFPAFRDAIVFVNRVAGLADDMNHHPDIDIRYDKVKLRLSSHDAGGVTERDLTLAQAIEHSSSAKS
ncbi:MAG: 4a-hydroxytetrahydrobiopterin dehydratase [Gemmatimonadetes bacterium]|nr:4a-hydroxytetrahydrobiopterin dehydratase [Gemmatimonadota bacterium]